MPSSAGRVIDVACGSGKLLGKIYEAARPRLLVGSDYSEEMLEEARQNLLPLDVCIKKPQQLKETDTGVILVRDNLINSELSENFFDVVLFTFPEIGTEYTVDIGSKMPYGRIIRQALMRAGPAPDTLTQQCAVVSIKGDYELTRITKPGGIMLYVHYDVLRPFSGYKGPRANTFADISLGRLTGRELFFDSPKIWADTEDAKTMQTARGLKKGYVIVQKRKLY